MRTRTFRNDRRIATLVGLVVLTTAANSEVLYVDDDAVGAQTGTGWFDAFVHLQDALDVAVSGDEVWVATGTYRPDLGGGRTAGDRTQSFSLPDQVAVYGGFAGFEATLDERFGLFESTVLSGDLNEDDPTFGIGDNSLHVVVALGVGEATRLDGFLIRGGNAAGIEGVEENDRGGGLYADASDLTVANCTFTGNSAFAWGGGVHGRAGRVVLESVHFEGNSAGERGGGMNVVSGQPLLRGCEFSSNSAGGEGGGLFAGTQTTVIDTNFVDNVATSGGGLWTNAGSTILGGSFVSNDAGGGGGGGLTVGSGALVVNTVINGNVADSGNGGGALDTTGATFVNCTIVNNTATDNSSGGGVYGSGFTTLVRNSILWGNVDRNGQGSGAQISGEPGCCPLESTCLQDECGFDPFVDPDGIDNIPGTADDNLTLVPGSSSIGAGDVDWLPVDEHDLDGDGITVTEYVSLDIAGNPRIFDLRLDRGAHEFVFPDCNLNGLDDDDDLAQARSLDCDGNQVPDECDPDCDGDGLPDACDEGCVELICDGLAACVRGTIVFEVASENRTLGSLRQVVQVLEGPGVPGTQSLSIELVPSGGSVGLAQEVQIPASIPTLCPASLVLEALLQNPAGGTVSSDTCSIEFVDVD